MQESEVDASSQGALYIPDMHIPDTFGETRPSNAGGDLRIPDMLSEYLHFFLPDGELVQDTDELVQDKPSVMAGARARPHAGAAAHQHSFSALRAAIPATIPATLALRRISTRSESSALRAAIPATQKATRTLPGNSI